MPDDALVADGKALVAVHELDGVQGRVVEIAQIARPRSRCERGSREERHENGSHEMSSRSVSRKRDRTSKDKGPVPFSGLSYQSNIQKRTMQ